MALLSKNRMSSDSASQNLCMVQHLSFHNVSTDDACHVLKGTVCKSKLRNTSLVLVIRCGNSSCEAG